MVSASDIKALARAGLIGVRVKRIKLPLKQIWSSRASYPHLLANNVFRPNGQEDGG